MELAKVLLSLYIFYIAAITAEYIWRSVHITVERNISWGGFAISCLIESFKLGKVCAEREDTPSCIQTVTEHFVLAILVRCNFASWLYSESLSQTMLQTNWYVFLKKVRPHSNFGVAQR